MSTTYMRVRTTCSSPAPARPSAASMFFRVCTVWAYGSPAPTMRPSASVAVVPETCTNGPMRTAREDPTIGSQRVPVATLILFRGCLGVIFRRRVEARPVLSAGSRRVGVGAEEVERHVGFVPHDPGVVPRGDREQITGAEDDLGPAVHHDHRPPRYDQTDVLGPSPAGLVARPSDGETADPDQLEPPLVEHPRLVRFLETPDGDPRHRPLTPSPAARSSRRRTASSRPGNPCARRTASPRRASCSSARAP